MPDGSIGGYSLGAIVHGDSLSGDPRSESQTRMYPIWQAIGDGWANSIMAPTMEDAMREIATTQATIGRSLTWKPGRPDAKGRPTVEWSLRYPDGRVTTGTVRRKRSNIITAEGSRRTTHARKPKIMAAIIAEYRSGDESVAKIAKRHGVTARTIYQILEDAGVPKRSVFGVKPSRKPVQRDDDASATQAHKNR